jgi:carbonic anhydrase/acetyltransferase-like protein (isoleucine patch superfamily)
MAGEALITAAGLAGQDSPMTIDEGLRLSIDAAAPSIADDAWIAPGVAIIGAVRVHSRASVWYGSILRADGDRIEIGDMSNVQDGCIAHADLGLPVILGSGVSVGHRALLHGCRVGDGALIGMGAILLNGSVVGAQALVAAGTVVREGFEVPPGCLVAGSPGQVKRELADEERQRLRRTTDHYLALSQRHAAAIAAKSAGPNQAQ